MKIIIIILLFSCFNISSIYAQSSVELNIYLMSNLKKNRGYRIIHEVQEGQSAVNKVIYEKIVIKNDLLIDSLKYSVKSDFLTISVFSIKKNFFGKVIYKDIDLSIRCLPDRNFVLLRDNHRLKKKYKISDYYDNRPFDLKLKYR